MCFSSPSAPTPPPRAAEAAQMPAATPINPTIRSAASDAARRRMAMGAAGGVGSGTILTGSRGVTTPGQVGYKTLLGQ